jgi:acyl-CoA thioesterase-1
MKKRTKLLLVGIAIMTGILSGAFFIQTIENEKDQTGAIRVACVGDSITLGFGYPDDLWMLMGANYTVSNFGAGAATVSLSSRTSYMNQSAFQEAKQFQPNMVIIMLGANDASPDNEKYIGSFVSDYLKLISAFEMLESKPQVWIVKPPPIFHNGTGLSTEFFDTNVIPSIVQVAKKTNLPLIDVYSALVNHSDYFWDGVHPTPDGSRLIAQVIFDAVTSS